MGKFKLIIEEFKKFISKGNVLDLAVGVIIGASFGKIVSSLVSDIVMPLVGLIMGKVNLTSLFFSLDFEKYETLDLAKKAKAPILYYGNFLQSVVDFLIVGFAVFIFIKIANKAQELSNIKRGPTTKECLECCSLINVRAKKCPNCQSCQHLS